MARYLIVNADDFNLTDGVSRGILQAHRHGIVTGTTVLVNLPGLEVGRRLAAEAPELCLGLHANLTLGLPVLPAARLPSLVDGAGHFLRAPDRLAHSGDPGEIRDELAAQLDRFVALFGRPPSHLDSHHHLHRHPPLLDILAQMARDLSVPLRPTSPAQADDLRARGLVAVDRAVGDITEEALRDSRRLAALLAVLPDGVTELICHPGHPDAELAASSYALPRGEELRVLCDPAVRTALARAGIRLIGHRDLPAVLGVRP